jgi:hypothetical protein
MKFAKLEEGSIPEVGSVWKHLNGDEIYMRIGDKDGKAVFSPDLIKTMFASVRLKGGWGVGDICQTRRDSDDIEVLI